MCDDGTSHISEVEAREGLTPPPQYRHTGIVGFQPWPLLSALSIEMLPVSHLCNTVTEDGVICDRLMHWCPVPTSTSLLGKAGWIRAWLPQAVPGMFGLPGEENGTGLMVCLADWVTLRVSHPGAKTCIYSWGGFHVNNQTINTEMECIPLQKCSAVIRLPKLTGPHQFSLQDDATEVWTLTDCDALLQQPVGLYDLWRNELCSCNLSDIVMWYRQLVSLPYHTDMIVEGLLSVCGCVVMAAVYTSQVVDPLTQGGLKLVFQLCHPCQLDLFS